MSELLDLESILELLRQLGERLVRRGVEAEIYVVGGTAMVLAYDRQRLTRDVDAVTASQEIVEEEARAMAAGRSGLAADRFNGRVRPLLPLVADAGQLEAFAAPGITVSMASPQHMIAMKVRAARGQRDLEDILLLCGHLAIASVSAVLDVAEAVWGPGTLREESVFLVSTGLRDRGFSD